MTYDRGKKCWQEESEDEDERKKKIREGTVTFPQG